MSVSGTGPLLRVCALRTRLGGGAGALHAVDGVSFELNRGETFALLGESGCGKSMTALSLMRLLPDVGRITAGRVELQGQDLLRLPEREMRRIRGARLGMIFQEPMSSLNPVLSVGEQISESLRVHRGLRGRHAARRVVELLESVRIPDPARRAQAYPHQLSGGMKQRAMIAMALAGEPQLLIADEPTTALDVTIQAQVLDLLRDLQRDSRAAMLLITHDLGVVAETAQRLAVMYAGELVEEADCEGFFRAPAHPYSHKLLQSLPSMERRDRDLSVIPGRVPRLDEGLRGCRFAARCDWAWGTCRSKAPRWHRLGPAHRVRCHLYASGTPRLESQEGAVPGTRRRPVPDQAPLLEVRGLKVHFPIRKGIAQRVVGQVYAVDGVSLTLVRGQTLALVGESGCGKTTAGKGIAQLIRPTAGSVRFDGAELTRLGGRALRARRREIQFIFQDPNAALNPRMRVREIVAEGMRVQGLAQDAVEARVRALLGQVDLAEDAAGRYPHAFSGGQRQRVCIARALAVDPRLIICDEPTSALDVSVQAQILNLLRTLQEDLGLAYLFITHNLAVVAYLAHRVAVMYLGRIVERGTVVEVLGAPRHPYTQALLSAVPRIAPGRRRRVIRLEGELPSPAAPPRGCHFHPRCPRRIPACLQAYPGAQRLSGTHVVHCIRVQEG